MPCESVEVALPVRPRWLPKLEYAELSMVLIIVAEEGALVACGRSSPLMCVLGVAEMI